MSFLLVGSTMYSLYGQSWIGIGAGAYQSNLYYENSKGEQDKTIKGVPSSYVSLDYMYELRNSRTTKKTYDRPDY